MPISLSLAEWAAGHLEPLSKTSVITQHPRKVPMELHCCKELILLVQICFPHKAYIPL